MLRTAGRRLSRALQRSVAAPAVAQREGGHPRPVAAAAAPVVSSRRWLNSSPPALSDNGGGQLDEFGIATGLERLELEYQRQGKKLFNVDPPRGPFGTKEAPAIVESYYDVRIVGCSGGVGEDEHDVTWFHLEKGKTYECPVCTQVFQLKVIGEGGQPGHDEHH